MENPTKNLTMFRLDSVEFYCRRNLYAEIAPVLADNRFTREVLETAYQVQEYEGSPIGKDIGLKKRFIVGPKDDRPYQTDRFLKIGALEDISREENFDPDETSELESLGENEKRKTTRMLRVMYNTGDGE